MGSAADNTLSKGCAGGQDTREELLMSISYRICALLAATLAATVALGACDTAPSTGVITNTIAATPGFVPGVPNGFQCPLIPNGFDPAGSIYRLDKSGTYYRVRDYSKEPSVMALNGIKRDILISNYALSDQQTASAGLSFELLKNALPGLATDGSADMKKNVAVNIVVEDMMGESIDDTAADHILGLFKQSIEPKSGSTYYLVRETVKAGAVSYSLKHEDVAKLGGKAQMEGLAKASANVTFHDNNGGYEVKQKFTPDRIAVCVKSAEIVFDKSRSAGAGAGTVTASLKSPENSSMPPIKSVGKN